MRGSLFLAVAVLVSACHRGPGGDGDGTRVAPEPAQSGGFLERLTGGGGCDDIAQRFRVAMADATGRCTSDAECGCFAPVVAAAGCGGVTDVATADALRAIEAEFHQAECDWPHQCAPWSCEPACVDGRCGNAGSGGLVIP